MNGEAKDPTRNLLILALLVSHPGGLDHLPCETDVYLTGWFIVFPQDVTTALAFLNKEVDLDHCAGEWKSREIGEDGNNLIVTSVNVCKDT